MIRSSLNGSHLHAKMKDGGVCQKKGPLSRKQKVEFDMIFCGFRRIGLYRHKPSNHDEGGVLVLFIAVAKTGRFVRMDFFDKVHMPDVILVKRCCKNNGEIIRAALQGRLSQEQLNREMENEEYELFLRIRSQSRTGGRGRKVFRPRWEKYPTEVYRRKAALLPNRVTGLF